MSCFVLRSSQARTCGRRHNLQPLEHVWNVADVVGVVEDRVEIELHAVLGDEELPEGRARVPGLLGEALDDPVRVVALHPRLDEREQHPLGEQRLAQQAWDTRTPLRELLDAEEGVDLDLDAVFDYAHYIRHVPAVLQRLEVIPSA